MICIIEKDKMRPVNALSDLQAACFDLSRIDVPLIQDLYKLIHIKQVRFRLRRCG